MLFLYLLTASNPSVFSLSLVGNSTLRIEEDNPEVTFLSSAAVSALTLSVVAGLLVAELGGDAAS